jgi:hypothetical protein
MASQHSACSRRGVSGTSLPAVSSQSSGASERESVRASRRSLLESRVEEEVGRPVNRRSRARRRHGPIVEAVPATRGRDRWALK